MLAGCAGPGFRHGGTPDGRMQRGREEDDLEFSRFSRRGYEAADMASADPYLETWSYGADRLAIHLLVPQGATPSPLILYLPGLGESAEAGNTWRSAWSRAGYAVASFQMTADAGAWSSTAARNGDFTRQARDRFSAQALEARLRAVAFVANGIARRTHAAEGVYGRINVQRIAVAGFDIGAQTALALAGERHPEKPVVPVLPGLRAVLALSPHAVLARGGLAERFGSIGLPVLAVTGSEDADPYGIVESPHLRRAPFKYMPSGGKYQLVMEDGNHRFLSGGGDNYATADDTDAPASDRGREPGGMGRFPGFGDGGMGGAGGRMGGRGDMSGPPSGSRGRREEGNSRRMRRGMQQQTVIVERVSTAFLDATIKEDSVAREWLLRDAQRWADPLARLEMK